jgi:acyl-CoA thioester hydrolase
MAKPTYIEPNLPEWLQKFRYHTRIKVRFCETDLSGHVNNTSYLVYFEQARVEYLHHLKIVDENLMIFTADIWCHYHSEAYFFEELEVGVRTSRMGNSSLDLEYAILSARDSRLVATGAGTIVFMDKQTKKPTKIEDRFRKAIEEYERGK